MAATSTSSRVPPLQSIVDRIAQELDVDYALVSVLIRGGTHFRSAALCARSGVPPVFELPLAGTPCATVLDRGSLHAADSLTTRFPLDRDLLRWGAQSYAAIAIRDPAGRALGHIAVLDSNPMPDPTLAYAKLRALAGSVARALVQLTDCGPGEHALASDEARLIRRIKAGDASAFDEFLAANGERLLATARKIVRSEHDAQDVVQDALVSALRALPRFEENARLATWIHRITVNSALMCLRTRGRRREEFGVDLDLAGRASEEAAQPDALLERSRLARRIAAGFDDLGEPARAILQLRVVEDLDTRTVADRLGLTPSAVKTRLHRARRELRERLPDRAL